MTVVGSLRFARHEMLLWLRTWYGSAFSIFVSPILYLAGIGLGVGQLVEDGGTTAALGGVSYAAFAGTGLLAGTAMQTGAGDLSWPVFGNLTFTRTWEASTATPLRPGDIVGGVTLVVAARLALAGVVFGASMVILGLVTPSGAIAMIAPSVLIGLACGLPMFAFVGYAVDGPQISNVWRFVVLPLFILSGTFFPISELPVFAQRIAVISPLWHGTELIRRAGLGIESAYPPGVHAAILVIVALVGGVLTVRTLTKRLQP